MALTGRKPCVTIFQKPRFARLSDEPRSREPIFVFQGRGRRPCRGDGRVPLIPRIRIKRVRTPKTTAGSR